MVFDNKGWDIKDKATHRICEFCDLVKNTLRVYKGNLILHEVLVFDL